MIFKLGKTYKHTSGKEMTIIGRLRTHTWGECLIGEVDTGELVPVGECEDNAVNWEEKVPLMEKPLCEMYAQYSNY